MGHRPVMGISCLPSASPLQYTYCCYSQERPASQVLILGGLAASGLCPSVAVPLTLPPAVSPGVQRTTMWTTPRRCCRNGWPLWAMTTQLWSGGRRGSPGGHLRGKVLGRWATATTQRGKRRPQAQPADQGEAPTPWEHLISLLPQVLPRRRGSQALDQRKAPVSDGVEAGSPDLCQGLGG